MKRLSLLVVLPLFLAAATAAAFSVSRTDSHHVIKWYDSDLIIDIQLDGDGPTRLISGYTYSDVSAAMLRAVSSWNNVACSAIQLHVTGTSTSTTNVVSDGVGAVDGINRVVWIEQASRYPYSAQVLGVTSPVFYQDGTIIEADVTFNGVDDNWAAYANLAAVPGGSTNGQAVDIESVVVHELGHLIGLGHVLNGASMAEPPTMTPTVDPQLRTRTLETNDKNGACFLYPLNGNTTHACTTDDQCPQFISSNASGEFIADTSHCSGGSCTIIEDVPCGMGDAGERCCAPNCKGQLICQDIGGDNSYCATRCDSSKSNQCASGFNCVPFSGTTAGVCISQVVLGCSCDTNDSCTSSCVCDSDCGPKTGTSNATDDNNCSAGGHVELWGLLTLLCVVSWRRRAVA